MDSDVSGSANPGPEEGPEDTSKQGTEDPGPDGIIPGAGSSNPGPSEGADDAQRGRGSSNPGPEE
ncbi:hypothetical protein [uncultured Amnibacterium sp.]|uniref:hypothetical protein n=1 Tax=uncultured Amnibacterium sp. TaxID=1631851 RepID=UPI0035CC5D05